MKILFLIDTMKSGGAQKVMLSHCEYLLKNQYNITIISIKKLNSYDLNHKIKFYEIIEPEEKITTNIFSIIEFIASKVKDIDIIIGFSDLIVNYIAYTIAKIYNKPLLLSTRTHFRALMDENKHMLKVNKDLTKHIYKKTPLMATSNFIKEDLKRYLGIDGDNIIVLPNPIEIKSEVVKYGDEKYITIIGRLTKAKNNHIILKAFAKIKNKVNKNIALCFVGDGEEKDKLQKLSKKLDIKDRVIFKGFQKDVSFFLKNSHLMILASKREGFPNVILESFSQKTLILASDIEPIKELVKDNKNGVLFKSDDINDLADKILYCLKNNLNHCTEKAYKDLKKYKKIHKKFENILKKTVKRFAIENT